MTRALLLGIAAFLIVPMVIPFESSGTLTNVEAAGNGAEFATVNGLQVHIATEEYSGPSKADVPLFILLHGFGASTHSWRFVMKSLSSQGDVLAYDRPAFGYTERPTSWSGTNPYGFEGHFELLSALIEKYGKGQEIILGGHSAGGQIAGEYARLNPTKVQRLILVDPAVYTTGTGTSWIGALRVIPQIDRLGPFLVREVASSGKDLLQRSDAGPVSFKGPGFGTIIVVVFVLILFVILSSRCSSCDPQAEDCSRKNSGYRTSGGSYGGYSGGGGHK